MQNRFMVWLMLHDKFSTKTYYMCRLSLEPVFANIVLLGHIILCLFPGKELARLSFFSLHYDKWHK